MQDKEYILWAVKIGDPDYMEQVITTSPQNADKAKQWAKNNGFDRLRESTIDLSTKPDFINAIKS